MLPRAVRSLANGTSQVVKRNIETKYHMDEPLIKQYGRYMFDIRETLALLQIQGLTSYYISTASQINSPRHLCNGLALLFGISAGIIAAVAKTQGGLLSMGVAVIEYRSAVCHSTGTQLILPWSSTGFPPADGTLQVRGISHYPPSRFALLRLLCEHCPPDPFLHAGNPAQWLYPYSQGKRMKNSTIIYKHAMKETMLPM